MSELLDLLANAPDGTERVLHAFALAEALTDPVAEKIYSIVSLSGITFAEFRSAIAYSNIVEPRNSEWNVIRSVRSELNKRAALKPEEANAVHTALLAAAQKGDPDRAGWETPHYLFTDAGLAFHNAALGNIQEALRHYSESAIGRYDGNQWLAANFAIQQEKSGLLPSGAIETLFLRAMVLFRTGHRKEALTLLRQITKSKRAQREVAIALHIVANDDARRRRFGQAEAAYKRSIKMLGELNDLHGLAQTEHSLANMYAKQGRFDEAEAAYKRSINMLGELNDLYGLAQTEHSLANMYAKQDRFDEAEAAYKRSIEIGQAISHEHHVAQTEHSLANMYAKQDRFDEAEAAYKRSIEIGQAISHEHHVAQTEHSLANMYAKQDRFDEAEAAYKRSINMLGELNDLHGLAQTEHSLANMYANQDRFDEAEALFADSLKLLRNQNDKNGVAQVLRSRGLAVGLRNPILAMRYFTESLEINKSIRNKFGINLVTHTIAKFEEQRKKLDN